MNAADGAFAWSGFFYFRFAAAFWRACIRFDEFQISRLTKNVIFYILINRFVIYIFYVRCGTQVVREQSAKLLVAGSIPARTLWIKTVF